MPPKKDRIGARYGRWTVVSEAPKQGTNKSIHYEVVCDCGTRSVRPGNVLDYGQSKSCGCWARERSRAQHRETAGNWKGGRVVQPDGYVHVYHPDHPNAKKNGYVPEHRYVMSQQLGRPLLRTESVHHKNGVRDDNRPENLELWIGAHLHGGRVEDMIRYARELEALYGHLFMEDE